MAEDLRSKPKRSPNAKQSKAKRSLYVDRLNPAALAAAQAAVAANLRGPPAGAPGQAECPEGRAAHWHRTRVHMKYSMAHRVTASKSQPSHHSTTTREGGRAAEQVPLRR